MCLLPYLLTSAAAMCRFTSGTRQAVHPVGDQLGSQGDSADGVEERGPPRRTASEGASAAGRAAATEGPPARASSAGASGSPELDGAATHPSARSPAAVVQLTADPAAEQEPASVVQGNSLLQGREAKEGVQEQAQPGQGQQLHPPQAATAVQSLFAAPAQLAGVQPPVAGLGGAGLATAASVGAEQPARAALLQPAGKQGAHASAVTQPQGQAPQEEQAAAAAPAGKEAAPGTGAGAISAKETALKREPAKGKKGHKNADAIRWACEQEDSTLCRAHA